MAKRKTKAKAKAKTKAKPRARVKVKAKTKRKSPLSQLSYQLSDELAFIVGAKKSTRPQIVKKIWVYIKAHKCQDSKNRRMIVPDKNLSEIIGKKPIDMMKLAGHLNKHIKK